MRLVGFGLESEERSDQLAQNSRDIVMEFQVVSGCFRKVGGRPGLSGGGKPWDDL